MVMGKVDNERAREIGYGTRLRWASCSRVHPIYVFDTGSQPSPIEESKVTRAQYNLL